MAVIDSKKLLPPAKSSGSALATQKFLVPISNIKVKSSAIIKASDIKPVENTEDGGVGKTLLSEVLQIRKNVIGIQRVIASNTTLLQKSEERKRKLLEKKKFSKREQQLEKKDPKQQISLSILSLPRTGFLDAIKRFLFYTLLGAAFVKFGKHIPKILEFSKKLIPAFKFVEDFAGNVLNGVIDFVGAGYKAYDKVREITKQVGGEDLQKKFDEFSKQFNTFANLALIAGMSTMGGSDPFRDRRFDRPSRRGFDRTGRRVSESAQRRYASRYGERRFLERFGGKNLKNLGNNALKFKPQQSAAQKLVQKGVTNIAGKRAGAIAGKLPIVGPLIDFGIRKFIFDEPLGKAAAGAVGASVGQAIGSWIGGVGATALAASSFGLGALAAPALVAGGSFLGGLLGDLIATSLYTTISKSEKPIAKAQGGQVTRGGRKVSGPTGRTIKSIKSKPPKVKPQKTIPGKDVGGRKKIAELFYDSPNPNQRNPLGVLETTSESLKKVPLLNGVLGAVMGIPLDLVMGQKPDASVFKKIGYGFGTLVQNTIDAEASNTISNIQKEIVGLAGGGSVPRTLTTGQNIGMQIGERLAKTFEVMINAKVSETLQSIRQQFGKEGLGFGSNGVSGGGPGAGTVSVSSDSPDFWLLAVGALLENQDPQGAADVAQVIYNRVSSPSWPSTIRDVILQGNGGQFQPVRDYGNIAAWQSIKNKESAVNFIERYGKGRTQSQLESIAAALLDTNRQASARNFVGPRDSFRMISYEDANNHLADDTEQRRFGHAFGFEPGGAQIAAFRAGKLSPAQVSQQTRGTVTQLSPQGLPLTGENGRLKPSQLTRVGTLIGSVDYQDWYGNGAYLRNDAAAAFLAAKEQAKRENITIPITSAYRSIEHQRALQGKYAVVAAPGTSRHGEGIALDIQTGTKGYSWFVNNGPTYGWRYMAIPGDPVHFEYVGGFTKPKPSPRPNPLPASPVPSRVRTNLTRSNQWNPSQSGLILKNGVWQKASTSIAPTSPTIASGVNQWTQYGGPVAYLYQERVILIDNSTIS